MEMVLANETIAALDKAAENGLLAQKEVSQFKRAALVAASISELRRILTPKVMEPFMALQNTSIGFKTDNPNGYPVDVVRDCLIEATLKGVYPVGNEFNILVGRCYITKEGYYHKLNSLREPMKFSWLETPSIPHMAGNNEGAIIKMSLDWSLAGKKFNKDLELAIRVNKGQGADAIIGKALRKSRAWLFTAVTGIDVGDGDVDDSPIETTVDKPKLESPFEKAPEAEAKEEKQDELPM